MSSANPFDIFLVEADLGVCRDRRPALIVRVRPGEYSALLISAQMDTRDPESTFLIEKEDPGFQSTGLKKASYVLGSHLVTLSDADLVSRLGSMGRNMREDFKAWWMFSFRGPSLS